MSGRASICQRNDRWARVDNVGMGIVPRRVCTANEFALDGRPNMDFRMATWQRSNMRSSRAVGKLISNPHLRIHSDIHTPVEF